MNKILAKKSKEITEAEVVVLNGIMDKVINFSQQLDTQTNILIGVSIAIFVFSSSDFNNENIHPYFLSLSFFAGISSILGLLVMHPPKFMRPRGAKDSVMFIKAIAESTKPDTYVTKLSSMLDSREKTIEQYALETYNLSVYYYQPKRRIFNLAKDILLAGIAISLVIFIVSLLTETSR